MSESMGFLNQIWMKATEEGDEVGLAEGDTLEFDAF